MARRRKAMHREGEAPSGKDTSGERMAFLDPLEEFGNQAFEFGLATPEEEARWRAQRAAVNGGEPRAKE